MKAQQLARTQPKSFSVWGTSSQTPTKVRSPNFLNFERPRCKCLAAPVTSMMIFEPTCQNIGEFAVRIASASGDFFPDPLRRPVPQTSSILNLLNANAWLHTWRRWFLNWLLLPTCQNIGNFAVQIASASGGLLPRPLTKAYPQTSSILNVLDANAWLHPWRRWWSLNRHANKILVNLRS